MRTIMVWVVACSGILAAPALAAAQSEADASRAAQSEGRVRDLKAQLAAAQERVAELEARVARLEKALASRRAWDDRVRLPEIIDTGERYVDAAEFGDPNAAEVRRRKLAADLVGRPFEFTGRVQRATPMPDGEAVLVPVRYESDDLDRSLRGASLPEGLPEDAVWRTETGAEMRGQIVTLKLQADREQLAAMPVGAKVTVTGELTAFKARMVGGSILVVDVEGRAGDGGVSPAEGDAAADGGRGAALFNLKDPRTRNVAYVVDRSGSMTDTIMYVKHELKRSIGRLNRDQKFYVAFYSSGPAAVMDGGKLLPATEANIQRACRFVDRIVPVGQTDPRDALKQAFDSGADTIFLLTDGEFGKDILPFIARLNRDRKVIVNTICFIYTADVETLKQIAEQNRGSYKYVGESDLDQLAR